MKAPLRFFAISAAAILLGNAPSWAANPPAPRQRAEVEALLRHAPATSLPLRPLHVLLVAGPKDHGPGEHDYPQWQKDWAPLLAKADNVRVSTAFPWPKPDQWQGVDLGVVFYPKTKWDAAQLAEIEQHQDWGGGGVTIHRAIGCDQDWDDHTYRFDRLAVEGVPLAD